MRLWKIVVIVTLRTTMQYTLAREHLRSLVKQEPIREELRDLA